jgi:hypothetical protein
MGRTNHPFIEYERSSAVATPFSMYWDYDEHGKGPKGDIVDFNPAELFVQRNYALFDALGAQPPYSAKEKKPFIMPRGLPSPISFGVSERYYCVVSDPKFKDLHLDPTGDFQDEVTSEQAEEWIRKGLSHYGKRVSNISPRFGLPERKRVSNADWHSASWLFLDEIHQCLQHFGLKVDETPIEFRVITEIMASFEQKRGHRFVRLVYWFDN